MVAKSLKGSISHDKDFEVYLGGIVELLNEFTHRIDFLPQNDLLSYAKIYFAKFIFMYLGTEIQAMIFESLEYISLKSHS